MNLRATNLPLSAVVTSGVAALVAIASTCAGMAVYMLHSTRVGELEAEQVTERSESARQQLLVALLDQEAGRRGVVSTGNPRFLEAYQRGLREEQESWTALHATAGEATLPALARLERAVDAWHEQIVAPQLLEARAAPVAQLPAVLEAGKARFDEIRAAVGALGEAQTAQAAARRAALQRRARHAAWAGRALLAALLAAGALLLLWAHRRVAVPLQALARRVESGERLDPPAKESAIREIATLHGALVRLDRRVTEREAVLRAEREDAELLGRFGEIVQQTTSESELYRLLVRFLELAVAPTGISVFCLNPSENHLALVHPARSTDEQYRIPIVTEPMRCRAVRSARDVLSARCDDPGACDCPLAAGPSSLCLPLMATGQVIGLVALQGGEPGHWSARRVHLAQALCTTASATLNSIRLVARTRDNAVRDPLTQAYNRRFLVEVLPKLVHQSGRTRAPLSALMIDVDRFKDFNDRHGHDAGDRVLAAVARTLAEQIRISDTLVRYGGEEFAVLLPNTSQESALLIAERAREAVESTRTSIPQSDRPLTVTISVGVASLPVHGSTGDDLLLAADKALFRAKDAGRNRVVAAQAQADVGIGSGSATMLALAAGA
jgi:diguanylate cyclase (GGDEF)-like protein